ncbi:hypothetical protein KIW84_040474 [Lathyrus oleraceus]|uniref:Uncharacterized protein n=1 Tax=Pisum sativum TaxID=3888 RepID=A0A9D4XA40_PEA|nr:hypothetical protein KIW84_UN0187 [Pisum sativum]KAI5415030.1 hypothetical protein KIW84_040474 [Pisum sativum]
MSGIAIVCVCWLYAFAWNGEHHNPSHFSSCAFGVCLCVPVCLAYKMDSDPIVLAFGIGVMINRDSRGHSYFIVRERKLGARRRSDTVLVSTINDADQGSADVAFRTPLAPYEKSKSLGSGGSMVARLKLKGIDGRAPPGVEPAA